MTVPSNAETGAATMTVVANGISSTSVNVNVISVSLAPTSISMIEGTSSSGGLTQVLNSDNTYFSMLTTGVVGLGQVATAEATFQLPSNNVASLAFTFESSAVSRASALYFVYDWNAGRYVSFGATPQTPADKVTTFSVNSPASYINGQGQVKIAIRGLLPSGNRGMPAPFTFKIDQVKMSL